jgi:hypothetical protein
MPFGSFSAQTLTADSQTFTALAGIITRQPLLLLLWVQLS